MVKRSLFLGVFLVLAGLLAVACDNRLPAGVPPAATPSPAETSATATGAPTATRLAAASASPTPSPTATVGLTATAAVTATLPPEVTVLKIVNIRSGPSQDYPIVGYIAGDNWPVLGRSADGQWWRIECPPGAASDQCWITAGEESVAAVNATAAPVAATPPLPTATATPTTVPCVVNPGSGWARYQVVSGDTLSSIAARYGGSIAQIMGANCLTSDAIVAGESLWVPAGGSGAPDTGPGRPQATPPGTTPGVGGNGAAPGQAPAPSITVEPPSGNQPSGIAATLSFIPPNDTICPEPSGSGTATPPALFIGNNDQEPKQVWAIAEDVCIYLIGFDPAQPLTLSVTIPDASRSIRTPWIFQPDGAIWASFVPLPGDPIDPDQSYLVEASQAGEQASATFNVVTNEEQKLNVVAPAYRVGDVARVALTGIAGGHQLYLYRLEGDGDTAEWRQTDRILPMAFGNRNQEALVEFPTTGLEPGVYVVHTGSSRSFYYGDPEVFILTP